MSSRSKIRKNKNKTLPKVPQSCRKCSENDEYDDMVQCEAKGCRKWFHYSCVGFREEFKDQEWHCEQCSSNLRQKSNVNVDVELQKEIVDVETTKDKPYEPSSSNLANPPIQGQSPFTPSKLLELNRLNQCAVFKSVGVGKPTSTPSDSKSHGIRSRTSTNSAKLQTQLKLLEEERKLREEREKDYLRKKRELYEQQYSSSSNETESESEQEDDEPEQLGKDRVERWVRDSKQKDARLNDTWLGGVTNELKTVQRDKTKTTTHHQRDSVKRLDKNQIAARQIMSKEQVYFHGHPEEWPLFISWWENSTRSCGYTKQENLLRLQRCIKGDALKKLKYKLVVPEQVDRAIETLRMLYGRPEIIIENLLQQIRIEPPPRADRLESLIEFSMLVENICITMQASGLHSHLNNSYLLKELVDRLPTQTKLSWGIHKQILNIVDLKTFSDWLAQVAQAASEVTTIVFAKQENKTQRKSKAFVNVHQSQEQHRDRVRSCCVCGGGCKTIYGCQRFINLNLIDKWSIVKQNFLCRTCLRHHGKRRCLSTEVCGINGCNFRHHRLLHDVNKETRNENVKKESGEERSDVKFSGTTHRKGQSSTLFKIIPVTLYYDSNKVDTYAFLDDGSSVTLMEEKLAEELEADGKSEPLCLKWTANTRRNEENSRKIDFQVSAPRAHERFALRDVHTVKSLELPKQSLNVRRLLTAYKHLRVVPLKAYENVQPRLLIGLQHCNLGVPSKTIEGKANEPVAMKTKLGWTVFGTDPGGTPGTSVEASFNFHECECQKVIDDEVHKIVKDYFTVESFGAKTDVRILSKDDAKAVQLLEQNIEFDGERYTVPLLWKHEKTILPDSKDMAERRLSCLEKKMAKEPELHMKLDNLINEYVEKGYARKLRKEEIDQVPSWYLPTFPVLNPNKPNKVRVVWDAAAKVNGVSLNSCLLTGPDEVPLLTGVLSRFREGRFAIFGDIREMFHQIRISKEDQHFQRFLWRNKASNEVEVFMMLVMIFGSTSSPFCAQYVKNRNAQRFADQFPRACLAVKANHFVDDYLDCADEEQEAVTLAKDVIFIHQQGGFEIRNFMSNSEAVLKALQGEAITKHKSFQDLSIADSAEKLLGMWWSAAEDNFLFTFKTKKINQEIMEGKVTPTKREVLSALMCVFDPLGLIANFMIKLKILLQDVWRSSIGWDEKIQDTHFERWKIWLSSIPEIKKIRIPRYYFTDFKKSKVQLHVFVDASDTAYAAVAYFRASCDSSVQCALASARTRVGPIKPISIPRMELEAAVLGTRLARAIVKEHSVDIVQQYFWTDSRVVLCWIKSDHRKYKSFVAVRVGEILEKTDEKEWRWISSKENVADEATKLKNSQEYHSKSRWYKGPHFLYSPEEKWPSESPAPCNESETDHEVKECYTHIKVESQCIIQYRRFSNWNRLLRATMFALRFLDLVSKLRSREEDQTFSINEVRRSENYLYKHCQIESFPEEYAELKNGAKNVNKTSALYRLSPYLDAYEIMRIKGRIDATPNISHQTKRPIILQKHHYVTTLILLDFHKRFHHIYNESVVNEVRQLYYIQGLRTALKTVQRDHCQECKNQKAIPVAPIMAELPAARLQPFTRPFSFIGIDYFGPLYVKIGRRAEKRWGVLITCLTVRAIHIEIAYSLSSDSCILALKRFIARRGMPIEVYSDNGTNFRGASTELKEAVSHLDKGVFAKAFDMQLKWNFIPPLSPHMGGSWERLVRSVKQTLTALSPTHNPTDELLLSMMAEVEFLINSRPLTYVPINSENDEAITPNHFLLGSSSGRKLNGEFDDNGHVLRRNWLTSERYADLFWRRWVREYLPDLTRRTKWFRHSSPIKEGDVVVVVDANNPRCEWPKGRIVKVLPGPDGEIRSAVVKTATGVYTRPVVKLAVLDVFKFSADGNPDVPTSLPGGSVEKLDLASQDEVHRIVIGGSTSSSQKKKTPFANASRKNFFLTEPPPRQDHEKTTTRRPPGEDHHHEEGVQKSKIKEVKF